jgi:DNA-binding NarL/FixJ family response regulator
MGKERNDGMIVLLADDSELIRNQLHKLVSVLPGVREIRETWSLFSTLSLMEREMPDAVILDIQLPDGSGLDVLNYLRTCERSPLIIILTNYPSDYHRRKSYEMGADFFFDKTSEYEKVLEVLAGYEY